MSSFFNRAPKAPFYETTPTLAMSAALTKKWWVTPEVAEQAAKIMRWTHDAALDIVAANDNTTGEQLAA